MPIGTSPDESPDKIAEALQVTNAMIASTGEHKEGVRKAIEKSQEHERTVYEPKKPMALGSTAYEEPEEQDPTKRDYKEADFSTDVRKWMVRNFTKPCAFELKVSTTDSIPFSRLEAHQKEALLKVKRGPFVGLIRNDGMYKTKLPFDGYFLNQCAAWVIVMFSAKKRGQSTFYVIDIEAWCKEEEGERKSLTTERAAAIGTRCQL